MPEGVQKQREAIKALYPGLKWKQRVDKMSADQVQAIYLRALNNGKI